VCRDVWARPSRSLDETAGYTLARRKPYGHSASVLCSSPQVITALYSSCRQRVRTQSFSLKLQDCRNAGSNSSWTSRVRPAEWMGCINSSRDMTSLAGTMVSHIYTYAWSHIAHVAFPNPRTASEFALFSPNLIIPRLRHELRHGSFSRRCVYLRRGGDRR